MPAVNSTRGNHWPLHYRPTTGPSEAQIHALAQATGLSLRKVVAMGLNGQEAHQLLSACDAPAQRGTLRAATVKQVSLLTSLTALTSQEVRGKGMSSREAQLWIDRLLREQKRAARNTGKVQV